MFVPGLAWLPCMKANCISVMGAWATSCQEATKDVHGEEDVCNRFPARLREVWAARLLEEVAKLVFPCSLVDELDIHRADSNRSQMELLSKISSTDR